MLATDRHRSVMTGARIPSLDGLRGLAIVLVIVFHARVLATYGVTGFEPVATPDGALAEVACRVIDHLWIGVDLFFVLSGFLITGRLLKLRDDGRPWRARAGGFYRRRAARILPMYGLFLAGYFALPMSAAADPSYGTNVEHAWVFLTFCSNFYLGAGAEAGGLTSTWSLCIEEQFYLAWPLVVWWGPRRWLGHACFALALGSLALRLLVVFGVGRGHPEPWIAASYYFTLTHADGLCLGSAVAVASCCTGGCTGGRARALARVGRALRGGAVLTAIAFGLSAWAEAEPPRLLSQFRAISNQSCPSSSWLIACASWSGAWLIARLVAPRPTRASSSWLAAIERGLSGSVLRRVGRYSYSMYLTHSALIVAFYGVMQESRAMAGWSTLDALAVASAVGLTASMVLGALLWHGYERPWIDPDSAIRRRRRRVSR